MYSLMFIIISMVEEKRMKKTSNSRHNNFTKDIIVPLRGDTLVLNDPFFGIFSYKLTSNEVYYNPQMKYIDKVHFLLTRRYSLCTSSCKTGLFNSFSICNTQLNMYFVLCQYLNMNPITMYTYRIGKFFIIEYNLISMWSGRYIFVSIKI